MSETRNSLFQDVFLFQRVRDLKTIKEEEEEEEETLGTSHLHKSSSSHFSSLNIFENQQISFTFVCTGGVCVCGCVGVCVRACVRACVCVSVWCA